MSALDPETQAGAEGQPSLVRHRLYDIASGIMVGSFRDRKDAEDVASMVPGKLELRTEVLW